MLGCEGEEGDGARGIEGLGSADRPGCCWWLVMEWSFFRFVRKKKEMRMFERSGAYDGILGFMGCEGNL